jgi:hypothetical protein
MSCDEALPYLGAAPAALPIHVAEHVRGCADCDARLRAALRIERDLERALALPVPALVAGVASSSPGVSRVLAPEVAPEVSPGVVLRKRSAPRWALAASVALAALVGLFLWAGRPGDTLAAAIVTHVDGEPDSWSATKELDPAGVGRVLAASGVRLDPGSTDVVYAHSCWFKGHWIPHLVLRTDHGPVTVLVLREEPIGAAEHFRREGFDGTLVPFGRGSLAVLGRNAQAVTPQLLQRLQSALHTS